MKALVAASLVAILLLACGRPASALVEPEDTQLQPRSWMVNIYVINPLGFRSFLCKGALISGRWVLTAARCPTYDPYRAVDPAFSGGDTEYAVIVAGQPTPVRVLDFVQSQDGMLALMYLEAPVAAAPLKLGTATEAELLGAEVQILGTERSEGIRDSRYNAGTGLRMNCDIDGAVFVTGSAENGGAFCYLMSRPDTGTTLYRTRARVIDPAAPGAPNSPVDVLGGFDRSGSRLYLDFRVTGSYPCHEDLGAPVLREAADGTLEAVGVVTAVGMAAGLPLCGPALFNTFSSVAHHYPFILEAIAQKTFELQCPGAPEPQVEYGEAGEVRLYWQPVSGAAGYRLHYTAREGYVAIRSVDLGDTREYRATLREGVAYSVALSAYNADCSSPVSDHALVAPG